MIASSSCTLRASSSKSDCKSWNFFKLKSYQRSRVFDKHGGAGLVDGRLSTWPLSSTTLCSSLAFQRCCGVKDALKSLTPGPKAFKMDLNLLLASYSPCIPIIVSRIKTLSAKIFRASRIWCIPSPCGDRYSRQGIGHKPNKSARQDA